MGIDNLYLFIAAGLMLNLTPGPDVLYIVANGLRSGARAGVAAALGITCSGGRFQFLPSQWASRA